MFHQIPDEIKQQMKRLEGLDAQDRVDGTPRLKRLRQIPPETGRYIALNLLMAPAGKIIEVGTSAGYSTLWLALAGRARGEIITTFEVFPEKVKLARETFAHAKITDSINLVEEDAREHIPSYSGISFCFLDAEKDHYQEVYDQIIPRMCPGGIFLADNAINHAATLQPMIDRALNDHRVDAMVIPVGKGVLFCRIKN